MPEPLAERLAPYVPRVVLRRLVQDPALEAQEVDGTVVFVDLSGFTKLSERLARLGREGAECLVEGRTHVERGCRSAVEMRRKLRTVGRIQTRGGRVRLRMSVGVHTDVFPLFLVGRAFRELVTTGPAWTTVVGMEAAAEAGEIM